MRTNIADHRDLRVRGNRLFYQDVCSVIFPTYYKSCTLSQLETRDSCIAANQNTFWELDGDNHNIFTEQPCPTGDSSSTGSSRVSITAQDIDTTCDPPPDSVRLGRSALTEGGRRVCSPYSCRSLWWCRQSAPPLTAKAYQERRYQGIGTDTEHLWKEISDRKCIMFYNIRAMHMK